ncbi:MAG: alpha-amylase [Anaerolineaceae bacterium]|nr:alpha-amylase [Anaerolineaceae bacterium]
MNKDLLWWQKGIIYQIYPRSYQDSNNDGIGDLPGIRQRLDHLHNLNIDAVWLSPIYPSPMHDFGYDVADYVEINPLFGTMADFDALLADLHARGLKLIIDLVPNHTSDEHAWFQESRSSRDNPKRDWYIWRDPAPDGGPPNNWLSFFGGPAWTFDEATGQYYLHQFVTQQPELNYRHPEVLPAMLDVMRFWLDKGVDGFRVDVIWLMMKDEALRDEPANPNWDGVESYQSLNHIYTQNLPEVHDLIRQMRAVLDEYDERMMVGEIYLPYDQLVTYYGTNFDECHMPFNFHLILSKWEAKTIRRLVDNYEAALPEGAWPNWVLGNHDQHRVATRVGADQARVANMLLLTLRGTPTSYYGEEIGMEDGRIPPEYVQDPPAVNQPEIAHIIGRDPERTPMQWDSSPHAGFTGETAVPWLPVADNYTKLNVAAQNEDPTSMLNLYRTLAALRRAEPALHAGSYRAVEPDNDNVFTYLREDGDSANGRSFLIVLNFTGEPQEVNITNLGEQATITLATNMQRSGTITLSHFTLAANEGLILQL